MVNFFLQFGVEKHYLVCSMSLWLLSGLINNTNFEQQKTSPELRKQSNQLDIPVYRLDCLHPKSIFA